MKKTLCILLALCFIPFASAEPLFSLEMETRLGGENYVDGFTAEINTEATDGYDPAYDIMQPPMPPSGMFVNIYSIVNFDRYNMDLAVTKDSRNYSKKIEYDLMVVAMEPTYQGVTGTNTLTWNRKIPKNYKVKLIDYGMDSTRTKKVDVINIRGNDSYSFDIDGLGIVRYLTLKVERKK